MSRLTTTIAIAAIATSLAAQENQPVQHATQRERAGQVSVGYTDILDTYLSQEKFTGTEFGYLSQTLWRRDSSKIVREAVHHVLVSVAGTRLLAGGAIDGTLGGAYDTRNSNNPAQARIALSIDPTARLTWQLHTGRRPLALHYDVTMPLIGMAFSPNYGQSYYEIFSRGDYDHNIVCTSPFSAPQLYQHLSLDFRLWRTTFRVGYLGEYRQMKANNLKYHQYTHSITLGWCY